jgi:serine/threonine protein kinase
VQDLSGGNVMLTASSSNVHGFAAKVGDYGLARRLLPGERLKDNDYGTVTHMPPELLLDGAISKVRGWRG